MIDDCKGCKFACKNRDFYTWGEIRFCRTQMMWLITHIAELGEGNWPTNPEGSSYVDPALRSKSFRDEAYFVKPSGMLAEIKKRLSRTGEDGITLMEDIHSGIRRYEDLKSVAKRALNYISGFRQRKESYSAFKYRSKKKGG